MFDRALSEGRLMRPFAQSLPMGSFDLAWTSERSVTPTMQRLIAWISNQVARDNVPDARTNFAAKGVNAVALMWSNDTFGQLWPPTIFGAVMRLTQKRLSTGLEKTQPPMGR